MRPAKPLFAIIDVNSSLCVLAKLNPSTTKSLITNLLFTRKTLQSTMISCLSFFEIIFELTRT